MPMTRMNEYKFRLNNKKNKNYSSLMDARTLQYEGWLKTLRYMLLAEGVGLFLLSMFFGRINGFVYVFVILNSIFLFCEINLKSTYQMLIVINLFLLVKEVIEFLMFLFYPSQEDNELEIAKPSVMYALSVLILCKLILVSWRHYQNKILNNVNHGDNPEFMEDF